MKIAQDPIVGKMKIMLWLKGDFNEIIQETMKNMRYQNTSLENDQAPKNNYQRAFKLEEKGIVTKRIKVENTKEETCLVAQAPDEIFLGINLEPDEWIKDSGCSKHITVNRKLIVSYKSPNIGETYFFGSKELRGKIIGKGQICDNKCKIIFTEHDREIIKDEKVIGKGIRKGGIYVMKLGNKPKDKICFATLDENSTLWHRRLGHANIQLIQSLASK
ncbi:retrovirus-related pol polyprotein from transposon TNT 1-94 [Tanacetum coccineum]